VKRLLELLGSLRLTLFLLVALAALLLLGLSIPQKQVLQRELYTAWERESPTLVGLLELFQLTDVHASWLAKGLWVLFFANLAVVMVRRLPVVRERIRIDREIPDPRLAPGFGPCRSLPLREGGAAALGAVLRRRGLELVERAERTRGVKYRFAPVATLAYHVSFFLIAAGGYLSAATRFEGTVDLGSGEQFTGDLAQYVPTPRLPRYGKPPDVTFLVEAIEPQLERGVPVGIRVLLRDREMIGQVIEVNRPYRIGDASFVFKDLGVAPLLIARDAAGRELFGAYVRLKLLQGRKDRVEILGQRFEVELFPDHVMEGGTDGTRSQEMRDPVLRLTLSSRAGRTVRASLRPGETMPLGPYGLTFADWRYWVRLYVRSERGIGLLWFGFALAAAGVAARLFLFRREFVFAVETSGAGAVLHFAGRAEYYRALFEDEVEALDRHLRETIGSQPGADAPKVG